MCLVGNAHVSVENVHAYLVGIDYAYSVGIDYAYLVGIGHAYLVGIGHVYLVGIGYVYLERAHVLVGNDPASFVEARAATPVFYVEERETHVFVEMEGRVCAYIVTVTETHPSFLGVISPSSEQEMVSRVSEVKEILTANCHVSYRVELYPVKKTQAVYVEGTETPRVTRHQRMRIHQKEWLSCVAYVLTDFYAPLCHVFCASSSDVGEGWAPRRLPLNLRLDVCSR